MQGLAAWWLAYYGLRGLALLAAPAVLGPTVAPPLMFFIVFCALTGWPRSRPRWRCAVSTSAWSGPGSSFGWVFASHMVGAGAAASVGGLIRTSTGDYSAAWFAAGVLCVVAAFAVLAMPRRHRVDPTAPGRAQLSLS